MEITYEDFRKVQIHVGTVLSVKNNEKARQPALVLEVDFGRNIGIKISSAKITHYYNPGNLVGEQIIAVCNFPTKNIAGIVSEVLILGIVDQENKVVLLHPSKKVENGLEVY
jgi:tRNA-binding protein